MKTRFRAPLALLALLFTLVGLVAPATSQVSPPPEKFSRFVVSVAPDGTGRYRTIAEAVAAYPSGGITIQLKRGSYAGGFTLPANTTLRGEGMRRTIITAVAGSPNILIGGDDVTIEDLKIAGQASTVPTATDGVSGTSIARPTLRRVWIYETAQMGARFASCPDVQILDSLVENLHTNPAGTVGGVLKGIYVTGSASRRPTIRGCTITGWSQAIGFWYGASDGLVTGCFLLDNYGFEDSAHTINRSAWESYNDTTQTYRSNHRFVGNVVDGSTSACLEVAQGSRGDIYRDNVLRNPGRAGAAFGKHFEIVGGGIGTAETTDILFEGNRIYSSATHDDTPAVSSNAWRITIRNNLFYGFTHVNSNGALYIGGLAGPKEVTIEGNQIISCRSGIKLETGVGDGCIIRNNVLRDIQAGDAIRLNNGSNHLVQGNDIEVTAATTTTGILVNAGNGHRILGNRVVAKTGYGILCLTADNRILDNYTENGPAANEGAIHLSGAAALRNVIERNRCVSTTNRRTIAVISGADYNQVKGNTLVSTLVATPANGLYISGAGSNNTLGPNHTASVTRDPAGVVLSVTVNTTQTTIPHGLGYTPRVVQHLPTSTNRAWRSAASDDTNIYLTSDVSGTYDILVR